MAEKYFQINLVPFPANNEIINRYMKKIQSTPCAFEGYTLPCITNFDMFSMTYGFLTDQKTVPQWFPNQTVELDFQKNNGVIRKNTLPQIEIQAKTKNNLIKDATVALFLPPGFIEYIPQYDGPSIVFLGSPLKDQAYYIRQRRKNNNVLDLMRLDEKVPLGKKLVQEAQQVFLLYRFIS